MTQSQNQLAPPQILPIYAHLNLPVVLLTLSSSASTKAILLDYLIDLSRGCQMIDKVGWFCLSIKITKQKSVVCHSKIG